MFSGCSLMRSIKRASSSVRPLYAMFLSPLFYFLCIKEHLFFTITIVY